MNKQSVFILSLAFILISMTFWGLSKKNFSVSSGKVALIYSGNLNGELEPCGCSVEGNFGGVRRLSTMLKQLRNKDPDLLLISSGGLIVSNMPQDQLTSQAIMQGIKLQKYNAIGVQWQDLSYGKDFIAKQGLPWVVSNPKTGQIVSPSQIFDNNQIFVEFFSWLDPKISPFIKMSGSNQWVNNDLQQLSTALKKAKQQQRLTILSSTYSLEKSQQLLPLKWVDILLIRSKHEVFGEPKLLKNNGHNLLVLEPGSRGMRIAKLQLTINHSKIDSFQHEVIALPESIKDDPELANWYHTYNEKVKVNYKKRVQLKKRQRSGESPFVGAKKCKACHLQQYKIWKKSPHSQAMDSLIQVDKSLDPNCIKCHSVGFEKEGGYLDDMLTFHLGNVQCESCHNAGRDHLKSSLKTESLKADKTTCLQCHNHQHSPAFDFEKYWSKIKH
ncbi:MAG: hypothetical protein HON94_15130 [Methylococcales bacterium]|jgi:2',3'-cyclic-nucleotide 2'-phosphodiesterase (5'-nucleotidase family)|nr:hypothetical protein [Methylococcales bacterium]MBT7410240.1 hypothetical protein [Methylococcales bacterium]